MKAVLSVLLIFATTNIIMMAYNRVAETSLDKSANNHRYSRKITDNWSFILGDSTVYSNSSYSDTSWRKLDLPHDWSVEGVYDTTYGTNWESGYLPAGIGWYRKQLIVNENIQNHSFELQFDGIYMNSTIWVNDHLVGSQHYGYTSFFYDVTRFLKTGKNYIAVRVDHSKPRSGRWFTGSGIYRNVWLRVLPKAHFKTNEQFVKTHFRNDSTAVLNISSELCNTTKTDVNGYLVQKVFNKNLTLLNSSEKRIQIVAEESIVNSNEIELVNPTLWSLENPSMHKMVSELYDNNHKLLDGDTVDFGIRKIEFSSEWGFKLNNKNIKVKGVCMHHEAGIYGAAVPQSILLYRLQLLKKMGCNAIRTSHNPFSPEFYTMCDTIGLLVLDEVFDGWEKEKAEDDYGLYFEEDWKKDVTAWIKGNRNHPSVFMYSIGNEVANPTAETQRMLIDFIKVLDDTRPITQGGHDPTRGMNDQLAKTQLDIKGFNGDGEEIGRYERYHKEFPMVPIIATEVPHTYQTRGVYRTQTQWRRRDFPAKWEILAGQAGTLKGLEGKIYPIKDLALKEVFPEEKTAYYIINDQKFPIQNNNNWKENLYYQSSYDNATVRSSARKAWQKVQEFDYVMGQFRWTAFDYLGETNQWPSRFANFGVIDIANLPKDHYYLYQSLWSHEPMVHILPHWTHPGKEGIEIPIVVYTNTEAVELFLNGKSLGKKNYAGEQLIWQVPYTPGTLTARSYNKGKLVAEESYSTAAGEHRLNVTSNKSKISADTHENALVFIDVVDASGNLFPLADDYITVHVSGAGKLKGVDNGNPIDLTPYSSESKQAFRGKLVAFIAAEKKGEIKIQVKTKKGIEKTIQLLSE